MPAAWNIADQILRQQLQTWLDSLPILGEWSVDLWVNDYTPVPGDLYSDYVIATWYGYATQTIMQAQWGEATVSEHVAITQYPQTLTFPMSLPNVPVTTYGYIVSDTHLNLVYSESWETPQVVTPPGGLMLTPVLRHGIYPPPDMVMRRRRRSRPAPEVRSDAQAEDE
jgi:hypothetical protein